ncbi:atrophin-1-like [Anopheles maculipalpis]|uniref:atrophin-1-like n=1 Tax=Anopheles maculipalpis TaxID=1496333 RepID=UPI00215973C4|nr:atrophin-1-like [Anopheles maculipalpis]
MAKPFMLPESGPGGGSSSSGAGPPNNAPSSTNTVAGNTAPSTPAPIGSSSAASASGHSGAPGHVPSAPIPVTGANSSQQYHLQQLHHHHQQLQQHYQSYQGSHMPLMGTPGPGIGGSLPVDPHLMLPMTPPASGFATAIQTPQMAPVNEQLVQALYEAIYRCSLGDGPPTPLSQSPPSASCSPFTNGGYYGAGQVFFPRTPANTTGGRNAARVFFQQTPTQQYAPVPQTQPTPGSANSHSSSSGVSSSLDTPSCSSGTPHYHQGQRQPIQFNWHDDGDSSESEGSSSQTTSSSGCSPHCLGSMDGGASSSFSMPPSANLVSPSSSGGTLYASVPPHLDYMAGREQLQEFPGKIPQRKRKPRTPKPKKAGLLEQPLMWQMAVTAAALIVLGCGYLAAR